MANNERIVTQLKKKNATSFDTPFRIGSSAELVLGVRGTNVNNIEENMLLGCDTITTIEELEDGVVHILREFRDEDRTEGYYYVDTYEFKNYSLYKRWISGNTFYVTEDPNDNMFDDVNHRFIGLDNNIYSFDESTFVVNNPESSDPPVITISTLFFNNGSGTDVSVAEKRIYAQINDNGKLIQKQIIKNLL